MHQYHISNAIFLLNGFPKKRDVCEKIMFRAWVGAPLKATLSQEPPCLHALPNHYLSIPRHLDLALMLAPHVRCTYESHLTSAGGFSSTTGTSPPPPTASTEPSSARSRWDLRLIFFCKTYSASGPGAPWWIWHKGWRRGAVGQPDLQSRPHCHSSWF